MALSPTTRLLATATHEKYKQRTSLLLFNCISLEPFLKIETDIPGFSHLGFSADGSQLWSVTDDQRLECFELTTGGILQHVAGVHRGACNALAMHPEMRCLSTGEAGGSLSCGDASAALSHLLVLMIFIVVESHCKSAGYEVDCLDTCMHPT